MMSQNGRFLDPLMSILWQLMFIAGVFIYGSHSILINLCKVDGKIPFNSASVVLLIELAKLLFSLFFFIPEALAGNIHSPSVKTVLAFSIPAVLYCINNNIVVHVQLYLDPASFQVLGNLKIATTAVLYWLIIKRKISRQKWISLFLVTLAGISNSYGGLHPHHEIIKDNKQQVENKIYVTLLGVLLMLLYCTISGLAGVYTEYILKRQFKVSLHLQNSLLYTYGVVLNFWAFIINDSIQNNTHETVSGSGLGDFFTGYSMWTFLIIITQAMNGLIMSAVMKHASNITRLIIIACAMVVTTILSVLVFSLQLNIYFILAFALVIVALKLYHH
ncbi:probable UDP-sugar transporter protein SLC35A4 isoform X2 [Actinia tenebrosa]|nr:probable UDP-sugar transporter protein SLC35A4 isoform X2 [Actinia tenebrosa]